MSLGMMAFPMTKLEVFTVGDVMKNHCWEEAQLGGLFSGCDASYWDKTARYIS